VPPVDEVKPLRFGHFEVRPAERVLRVDGHEAVLGARAFDLLLALIERRERLVTKQELLDVVWPGVVVEEHNIAAQISGLRKLLGARAIATVPGRGYRFTAQADDGGVVDALAPAAAKAAPAVAQTNLPARLTPLVGRDDDLASLSALLRCHRLVTMVGAGGIGKSLLVQHLLDRDRRSADYPHGVCWVELAGINDPAALPARIGEALGVRSSSGEPIAGLCNAVAPLTMLVALDNAEHLLADVAHAAAALLDAAPGLRLIVTSQAPLRLAAEQVVRVGPLAVPDGPLPAEQAQAFGAVALFVERARGADARFVLSDDSAAAAIELCRQLDGLPLAIELAAVRAPLLGMHQLAASMHDRLQLLTRSRDAAAPPRQQTLRAALEWSCSFLDERESAVFRRLGVMADSASLNFIQQVVADEQGPLDAWAVLDALGTLVERSLVALLTDDVDASSEPRYRLLESPRVLALEQLRSAGEEEVLRRRHATALAAAFDAAWDERYSGRVGTQTWAHRIMLDARNARSAIDWARAAGEPNLVVEVAATLCRAMSWSSHAERLTLADLCALLAEQVTAPLLRLRAWEVALYVIYHRDQRQALLLADKVVALARELDREATDRWPLYQALAAWISAAAFVPNAAPDALRAALDELTGLEDPRWPAQRLTRGLEAMRAAATALGTHGSATEHLLLAQRQMASLEAEGSDTAPDIGTLIDAELQCGRVQAAVQLGEQTFARLAGTRNEFNRTLVGGNLTAALLAQGDTQRSRAVLQAIWPGALQMRLHVWCSDYPVLLAALDGRPRTAARLMGYADAAYAQRGTARQPNEATARQRSEALARTALGDALFDALMAEGRRLRDEEVAALAFATEDSL